MKSQLLKLVLCAMIFYNARTLSAQYHSSLDFDGTNDYCAAPNASQLVLSSQAVSMSFWVYPRNTAPAFPNFDGFAGFRNNINCDFYILQLSATDVEARYRGDNGIASDIVFTGLQLNTWQHFLFVYDGTAISLYHNGIFSGTANASGSFISTSDPLYMGMLPFQNTQFFTDGKIDDVALWSSALTAADAQCLYASNALDLNHPSLELYYSLNDGEPAGNNTSIFSALDFSANKLNSDITGFALTGSNSNFVDGVSQNFGLIVDTGCAGQAYIYNGISYAVPGVYAVSAANGNCDSMFVLSLSQNLIQIVVSQVGANLTCLTPNATYQWLDCNNGFAIIPNATSATYTATVNGSYAVSVTQNGCTDTSICKNVISIGLQSVDKNELIMSPNPAQEYITLSGTPVSGYSIAIFDYAGRLVYENRSSLSTIDISKFSKGMYTLKLVSAKSNIRKMFVKK
ncbi:MAG: T9SS type A sorting domain-containing protein [Bacteroidetes bacterium]|nr:T9SS type A sorting domain-containing protein [Bacteroidota bacterium]